MGKRRAGTDSQAATTYDNPPRNQTNVFGNESDWDVGSTTRAVVRARKGTAQTVDATTPVTVVTSFDIPPSAVHKLQYVITGVRKDVDDGSCYSQTVSVTASRAGAAAPVLSTAGGNPGTAESIGDGASIVSPALAVSGNGVACNVTGVAAHKYNWSAYVLQLQATEAQS